MKQSAPIHRANGWRPLAQTVLLILIGFCILDWLATPAWATSRNWTHNSSQLWSDPNNWDPVGIPQNGDDLNLIDTGIFSDPDAMVNDLTNLAVNALSFSISAPVARDWILNGNTLIISNTTTSLGYQYAIQNIDDGNTYVHINCALKLATTATFATGGTLSDGDVTPLYLSGPIDLNGHALNLHALTTVFQALSPSVGHLYVGGEISGNGNVNAVADAEGMIEFNSPSGNSFHGMLTANAALGSLILFNVASGVVVTDTLRVNNVGDVQYDRPDQIGDNATVQIIGGATLQMNGYNDTIGNLILTNFSSDALPSTLDTGGGMLGLNGGITSWNDSGSVIPIIKGKLNLNGVLPFNIGGSRYAGLELPATMASAGGFSKSGSAALLLETNNTFTGAIFVNQGILDVRNNNALGSTAGSTTLTGDGSLTLRNLTITGETLFAQGNEPVTTETSGSLLLTIGTCSWTGPIQLDSNLIVFADNTTFSGQISGVGGLDFRNGTAIIGGSGGNTFTGTTLVRCPLLEFNKPTGTNAYAGPLVVGGGSGGPYEARWLNAYQNVGGNLTLYANGIVNLNNHNEDFSYVTFNGGEVDTGSGQFAIYQPLTVNPASTSAVINGYLGLPPGNAVFSVGDGVADCDLLVNAVMFGGATYFIKQGPGTMCLTAPNTYTGVTLLEEGILDVNNSTGLGSAGAVISGGATLQVDGSFFPTLANNFEMVGAGVGGTHGALEAVGSGSVALTGSILLDAATTVNVADASGLELNGTVYGTGPLTKTGPGVLSLGGPTGNSYSGDTRVTAGELVLAKPQFVAAVPGNLVLGPASPSAPVLAQFNASSLVAGTVITVNSNSMLDLHNNSQTLAQLNLNDGGWVSSGSGALNFSSGGVVNVGSQSPSGSHVGSSIYGNVGITPNDSVTFNVAAYASAPPFSSNPELDVPAVIFVNGPENPSLVPAGFAKAGTGRMRLGGNNTYQGFTGVNGGTLQVDGAQPQGFVVVNSGAKLQGMGTVGHIYMNGSSGILAPGDSPGILTCSNFDNGGGSGTFQVELNGTTPGSGYDQLNVRGTVNLAGVSLSGTLNFASSVGDLFTIINNDSSDAVVGTFSGLPQNAKLYIGGELFRITYTGGSGNDVVLTRLTTPPKPVLTIQRVPPASVRLLWQTNDPPFSLQSNTNLPATNWTAALPLPTIVGTNNIVTNSVGGVQRFYRLSNP